MLAGKLPLDMLADLLDKIERVDPRVVLGASPGEDAALIDMGDRYLVAKSDPITFATDLIGWYLVQVNANDLAVMGATPRWLMATLLLPEGVSEAEVRAIFDQLLDACRSQGIALIGGHTEVTHGLPRPIAVGALLGEAAKDEVVLTSGARPGDSVVLTKGIAIEGTAILAREAGSGASQGGRRAPADRGGQGDALFARDKREEGCGDSAASNAHSRDARPDRGRVWRRLYASLPRPPAWGWRWSWRQFPYCRRAAPSATRWAWTRWG